MHTASKSLLHTLEDEDICIDRKTDREDNSGNRSECESDAERLDVHNGLLLSALWDAAFDRALVTFDDQGKPEFSSGLSEQARAELRWHSPISLTDEHRRRLACHRERARGEA